MASAIRPALGDALQLLRQRPRVGSPVRPHVSVLSLLRTRLPESTSLDREQTAGRGHRVPAMYERLPQLRRSDSLAGSGRFPHGARPGALRSEVVDGLHAVFSTKRAATWMSASPLLRTGGILRQSHLPPPGGLGPTRRAPLRYQSHDWPTDETGHDLWPPGHQT